MERVTVSLSELGEIVGGATPSTINEEYYNGDIPWITPKDLSGYSDRYIERGERLISHEGFRSCSTRMLSAGSVLFTSRAPIGYVAIAKNDLCTNQGFKSIIPFDMSESLFIYYLLVFNKDAIEATASGTTFKEVSGSAMRQIKVNVPKSHNEKIAIASTLSSLDDKIELNNRIIANLEAQAQAIFKSWFVDFEPFQDGELEESEMGLIPKGWRVTRLGELCESVSITHNFKKRELIFLNTGDIDQGRFLHSNYSAVDLMPGQAKKSIKKNDILYSEIRPINKHFAYVNFDSEDYVVSTKLMVIRSRKINSRRLYQFLTKQDVLEELQVEAEARSGTFPQIRFENIQRMVIVLATQIVEENYNSILEPIYQLIDQRVEENKQLILVRDTLLPKLMSGETEVPVEG